MRKQTVIEIFAGVFIFIAVSGFGAVRYLRALESASLAQDQIVTDRLEAQQKQLDENKIAIDVLVKASKSAQDQIATETAKRLAAETARQADATRSAQQIAQLQKNIEQNKAVDLSSIISSWRPRVALIKCQWVFSNGTAVSGTGTGVLFYGATTGAKLITNGHVVTYQGYGPSRCTIKFPDDAKLYEADDTAITPAVGGIDAAFMDIASPSPYLKSLALASANRCASAPAVGDGIVILGYPSIGSTTDITATEGIVAGTDGDYLITSAKVERGNSGGAAILSKNNCYLGIPSFVDLGSIEALARILDQKVIGG